MPRAALPLPHDLASHEDVALIAGLPGPMGNDLFDHLMQTMEADAALPDEPTLGSATAPHVPATALRDAVSVPHAAWSPPPHDPASDEYVALIDRLPGLTGTEPFEQTMRAWEEHPHEHTPEHTPDSPAAQGTPSAALRRVPSTELFEIFNDSEKLRFDRRHELVRSGLKNMDADGRRHGDSVAQRMHDALAAKLGNISPALQPEHRAQMVIAIARLALERLGDEEGTTASKARSVLAETYVRQAGLIPDDLEITRPQGSHLITLARKVVNLPDMDQALYMETMCGVEFNREHRARALESMRAHHNRTGGSFTADLCDPLNGSTIRARWENIEAQSPRTARRNLGAEVVIKLLESRVTQAAPPVNDSAAAQS